MEMNNNYAPQAEDFEKATAEEKSEFIRHEKSVSYWKDAWRRIKKNTVAMVALYIIIAIVLFAYVGPSFVEYDYSTQIRGEENWPPFWEKPSDSLLDKAQESNITFSKWTHPIGTDNLGRDNLARLMYGTRISMVIGIVATLIVLVIGAIYGSIAGYAGGVVDNIMMRVVEVIYSVPDILIVLLLATSLKPALQDYVNNSTSIFAGLVNKLGPNLISIFITFGLLYWVGMARIVRGQVLMLKQQEYVTAARALGASNTRIIKKHLLPNCVGQITVTTCLQIPSAIFLESFMSFLGIGVSAPLTSLGSMASDGLSGIYSYPYRLIVPSILLSLLILSFNLFGDGLRDALDPRLKK
ncbi:MAG: ABC transporter permease [Clostridia bacterium]